MISKVEYVFSIRLGAEPNTISVGGIEIFNRLTKVLLSNKGLCCNLDMVENYARNGGFTLVEMMIAIGIIGILASIAIPGFQEYRI